MMASGPSSSPFLGFREEDVRRQLKLQQRRHDEQQPPSAAVAPSSSAAPAPPPKKKRNQPGNPNPDAEVIALSPKTLLATNRFVCEVCNKGFQREQNLQLHRRGHNLPWKLRQKGTEEPRRRVYLCPVPTCVHHNPTRALGDLTGIKKHYCRKHGEKKWKCDKCSKRYAVQSDWKAHSKTCGTREYRCDCGTLFSRRDSFVTHRTFCDALAQEGSRPPNTAALSPIGRSHLYTTTATINLPLPHLNPSIPSPLHDHHFGTSAATQLSRLLPTSTSSFSLDEAQLHAKPFQSLMQVSNTNPTPPASGPTDLFNLSFFSGSTTATTTYENTQMLIPEQATNAGLMADAAMFDTSAMFPQMSATALLQKAAQLGATTGGYGGQVSSRGPFGEGDHEAQLQDLVNSLVSEHAVGFGGYNQDVGIMNEAKLQGASGSEGLTRDFLGVGGAIQLGPLDSETKMPSTSSTI